MSHREHGTRAKYTIDGCRCDDCRDASRLYELERRNALTPRLVSAEPARRHVLDLMAQGLGFKRVGQLAGLSTSTMTALIYGKPGRPPTKRIKPSTAEAILAVTWSVDHLADGTRIDAASTHANIAKLTAAGVPRARIAERLGVPTLQIRPDRKHVTARTHRIIAGMAAELDAGTLVTVRRSRHGDQTIAPPAAEKPRRTFAESDEIDRLFNELADVVLERRQPWRAQAACRGEDRPTWMWFTARGDVPTQAKARRICTACPVQAECLTYAESKRLRIGMWGGVSIHAHLRQNAPTVECPECGNAFVAQGQQKVCSEECRHARHHRQKMLSHQRAAS